VLNEGQVVEQGTHTDLLAREGSLYRYYHALQFRWEEERPPQPGEAPAYPMPHAGPLAAEEEPWPDLATPLKHGLVSPADR
jgi:hypothetical protein